MPIHVFTSANLHLKFAIARTLPFYRNIWIDMPVRRYLYIGTIPDYHYYNGDRIHQRCDSRCCQCRFVFVQPNCDIDPSSHCHIRCPYNMDMALGSFRMINAGAVVFTSDAISPCNCPWNGQWTRPVTSLLMRVSTMFGMRFVLADKEIRRKLVGWLKIGWKILWAFIAWHINQMERARYYAPRSLSCCSHLL